MFGKMTVGILTVVKESEIWRSSQSYDARYGR